MVRMARIKKLSVVSKRLTGDGMMFDQVGQYFCVQDKSNRVENRVPWSVKQRETGFELLLSLDTV